MNRSHLIRFSLLVLFLVCCNLLPAPSTPTPTIQLPTEPPPLPLKPTVLPPAAAPPPTAADVSESPPPLLGPCEIIAESSVPAYTRPSLEAMVFGTMSPGFRVPAEGRTTDGWLGFNPGVAQAANIGVFRLRWVEESDSIRLEGACDNLPELDGPPAGVCFTMPMGDVSVYAEPDASSEVIAVLVVEDYTAVLGRTTEGWAKVDLSIGNTGLNVRGWIQANTLNMNGPCVDLPTIES